MQMMAEHGLIDKWAKVYFESDRCSGAQATDANPTSLMDVTGPLMFLFAGVLLAAFTAAAELVVTALTRRQRHRPSDSSAQSEPGDSDPTPLI